MKEAEISNIQWFPGHMAKTRRLMQSHLKLVDAVVEITDARVAISSRNPEMQELVGNKPRLVILNKCDTADDTITSMWIDYYKRNDIIAIATDCRSGKGINKFTAAIQAVLAPQIEGWKRKGMVGRPVRIMIVGIPNVGKSSLINRLSGSNRAKVEDRPGVTRGKQWVSLGKELEMLDMPGVLWPKFEDKITGERLAFTGAVKDEVMDMEHLACRLISFLCEAYPNSLTERYGVVAEESDDSYDLLEKIGRKRGFLMSGGAVNTERASITLIDEFRGGKLGKISFEKPSDL